MSNKVLEAIVLEAINELESFAASKKSDAIKKFESVYGYTPQDMCFSSYNKGNTFTKNGVEMIELTLVFLEVTRHDRPDKIYLTYNIEK